MSDTSPKFYSAANSNRIRITKSGREVRFTSCMYVGGTWLGHYKSDDASEQAEIAELIASNTSAIQEISKEEYDTLAKKEEPETKPMVYGRPEVTASAPVKAQGMSLSDKPAVVVEQPDGSESAPPPVTAEPVKSEEDVIAVSDVSEKAASEAPVRRRKAAVRES